MFSIEPQKITYLAVVATYYLAREELRATRKFFAGAHISACAKASFFSLLYVVYDILLHSCDVEHSMLYKNSV